MRKHLLFLILTISFLWVSAQHQLQITVLGNGKPQPGISLTLQPGNIHIKSNGEGKAYYIYDPNGSSLITILKEEDSIWYSKKMEISVASGGFIKVNINLTPKQVILDGLEISIVPRSMNGMGRLDEIHDYLLLSGKKNELITPRAMDANLSANNPRQALGKVPGLNIWENDGSGVQVGVSTRGLSPNRSWEFNVRQNGYDISSDPFGYPEAYYNPPFEAIRKIEFIRGASTLQFGPQYGGVLNYELLESPASHKLNWETRQTVGSYGAYSTFNALGGKIGKINYQVIHQYRTQQGWRENAKTQYQFGFASIQYNPSKKLSLTLEGTLLDLNQQQSGGLTDSLFNVDARKSFRARNWMDVFWFTGALTAKYAFNPRHGLSLKVFSITGDRYSVGNLRDVRTVDNMGNRDVLRDEYRNTGMELRDLYIHQLGKRKIYLASGIRLYTGETGRVQGLGSNGNDANFTLNNENDPENFKYKFNINNAAVFAEAKVDVYKNLALIPGIRYEVIENLTDGYYNRTVNNNRVKEVDNRTSLRQFPLFGLGATYKCGPTEIYSNFQQAYRAVTFNDLRVNTPALKVDSNLSDSKGYTIDLGYRGLIMNAWNFDVSAFYMLYGNRIGIVNTKDANGANIQLRTNVSDAQHYGVELFNEVELNRVFNWFDKNDHKFYWFTSASYLNATYINSDSTRSSSGANESFEGKRVEYTPEWTLRTGLTYQFKRSFSLTYNFSHVSMQYSDAQNTQSTANGNNGVIPAYTVHDLSLSYTKKKFKATGSINNLLDKRYFTRRAGGYPGPGIIPADGRTLWLTLSYTFSAGLNKSNLGSVDLIGKNR